MGAWTDLVSTITITRHEDTTGRYIAVTFTVTYGYDNGREPIVTGPVGSGYVLDSLRVFGASRDLANQMARLGGTLRRDTDTLELSAA